MQHSSIHLTGGHRDFHVFIYALIDPITKEARYVGKTTNPAYRLKQHIRNSNNERSHKWNWIKGLKAISMKPEILILETCPESEWENAEMFWISYLKLLGSRLTNMDSGGMGGKTPSDETREKLRQINKSRPYKPEWRERIVWALRSLPKRIKSEKEKARWDTYLKTRKLPPSTWDGLREKLKGKPRSPETINKMREAMRGKRPSEEAKKKISAALRGRKLPQAHLDRLRKFSLGRLKKATLGVVYGRYTVIGDDARNRRKWVCQCACGVIRSVDKFALINGITKSCGCLSRDNIIKWHRIKCHSTTAALLSEKANL